MTLSKTFAVANPKTRAVSTEPDEKLLFRSYGRNHILSNFFEAPIRYEGQSFRSAQHIYQWKCASFHRDHHLAYRIKNARTASYAKKLSQSIHRSPSWHKVKIDIMKDILKHKAVQCPQFASALKKTVGKTLLHNVESDDFWGCGFDLRGSNVLGVILNELRSKLLQDSMTLQQDSDVQCAVPSLPTVPSVPCDLYYKFQASHNISKFFLFVERYTLTNKMIPKDQ